MGANAVDSTRSEAEGGTPPPPLDLRALRSRVHADGMTRPQPGRNVGRMAAQVAVYLGLGGIGFVVDALWAWVVVSAVMGLLFLAPGAILHQSVHGAVFRSKWANVVVGEITGALLLFPRGTYRAFHIEHHATTATEDDPEGVPIAFRSRLELALLPLGGLYTLGQLWWFTARTLVGRPPRWVRTSAARRDIVRSAVVVAVFALGLVGAASVWPSVVLHLWLWPYLVAVFVVYPVVFLPEHAYGGPGPTLDNSRTTVSNRLVSWAFWNNNFHAIHHLLPMTVHQHARPLSLDVRDHQHGDWWNPGYLRYLGSLARRLPTLPPRRDGSVA